MTPDMKFSNSKTLSLLEGTSQPTGFLSSASDDGSIPVPLVGHWRANEDLVPSRPCAGSSYSLQTRSGSTRSFGGQIVQDIPCFSISRTSRGDDRQPSCSRVPKRDASQARVISVLHHQALEFAVARRKEGGSEFDMVEQAGVREHQEE